MKNIKTIFKKMLKPETLMLALCMIMTVFKQPALAAGGAEAVTSSFSTLTSIVTAIVSGFGEVLLLWAFLELGISFSGNEGTMQASAFKRVGGGLIMVLAPQLIAAFI